MRQIEPTRAHAFRSGTQAPGRNRRNFRRALACVCTVAILCGLSYRQRHLYRVESVLDGDTLVIKYRGEYRNVQLAGADAPEIHKNEPYAIAARDYLATRVAGKRVWVSFLDAGDKLDYKHRLLCWVWLDGQNISDDLVARGYARFSGAAEGDARNRLIALQRDARENGRGLWEVRAFTAGAAPRSRLSQGAKTGVGGH